MNAASKLMSLKNANWDNNILDSNGEVIKRRDANALQDIAASSWDSSVQIAQGKVLKKDTSLFGFARSWVAPLFGYRTVTFHPTSTYDSIQRLVSSLAKDTESRMTGTEKYKLAKHAIVNYHKYLEKLESKNEERDLSYVRFHNFNVEEMLGDEIMKSYKSHKEFMKASRMEAELDMIGDESEVGFEKEMPVAEKVNVSQVEFEKEVLSESEEESTQDPVTPVFVSASPQQAPVMRAAPVRQAAQIIASQQQGRVMQLRNKLVVVDLNETKNLSRWLHPRGY